MLSSRDATKAYEALQAVCSESLRSLDALLAAIDWEDPSAVRAAQTAMQALVSRYGGLASKVAAEKYAAGQAADPLFEPVTWAGLGEGRAEKLDAMVASACRNIDGSEAGESRTRKALGAILDQSIREAMVDSTLENGLREQAVVQAQNTFYRYRAGQPRSRAATRRDRRPSGAFSGVYYGIEVRSPIPCDWCIKQASRGLAFLSEKAARSVLASAHKSCTCQVFAGTEPPQGYEEKLAQYKDWYANGVPANVDAERKAQWEETRKARREEERAAERAAGNSD